MVSILPGDCMGVLATLEAGSVHCCVTSPPYWGLRDYGVDGQLGLEATPEAYVAKMVAVFREVRRVLRDDCTVWLNLGDSYATGAGKVGECQGGGPQGEKFKRYFGKSTSGSVPAMRGVTQPNRMPIPGLKPKDLVGIPWRVAFALQADGWYLRQDIIWHKLNPMPESVTDRCTKAHEYIFLLSKSAKYYYDNEAIKEPAEWLRENGAGTGVGFGYGYDANPKPRLIRSHKGSRFDQGKTANHQLNRAQAGERVHGNVPGRDDGGRACNGLGQETRNKRSVWTVATKGYKGAHFATFPPDLIRPCVLAGCPQGGTVLDPFAGSGTTGLVAEEEGRNSILIELNEEYVQMARDRTRQIGLLCEG